MRRFYFKEVVLQIGGATAKIGDPSGRSTERDVLTSTFIDENIKGVHSNIEQVFENHRKYFWKDRHKHLTPVK